MRKLIYLLMLVSSLGLFSCSTILNNLPGVYSLDIQQGNMIDQGMIDQLRPKMTKRQVLYIMGSPMLIDVLHQKRWDYLYSEQPGGEPRRQKRLSLFFEGEDLIGIQGDFRPSTLPVIKESNETSIEVPKRNLDNTLWGKLFGDDSDDEPMITTETTDPEVSKDSEDTQEKTNTGESNTQKNDSTLEAETIETETIENTIEKEVQENTNISIEPLEEEIPQELEEIPVEKLLEEIDANSEINIEGEQKVDPPSE